VENKGLEAGRDLRCERESKRDSEMFFSFSFLYCISAVNRNGAAVNYRETERDGECRECFS